MYLMNWNKALRQAVQENDIELLEICIANGADVNEPDRNGYTALMKAAIWSRYRAAKILLEHGADVGITNRKGELAYDLARRNKNKKIAQLLRKPTAIFKYKAKNKAISKRQKNFRRYLRHLPK